MSEMVPENEKAPAKILFVDDEENILHSLRRLFVDEDFELFTASSGADGIEILKKNGDVALIVSDQRMPGLTGVEFLEQAKELAPDTLRIILTGYADINATIDAINKGGAYRYIAKPWQDDDLTQTIRDAVRNYSLIMENKRLMAIIRKQKEEIQEWNAGLKSRVLNLTAVIRKRSEELQSHNDLLRKNYTATIAAFAGLVDRRGLSTPNHSSNVATFAVAAAHHLGLTPEEIEIIRIAALLHDVGKAAAPDSLMAKGIGEMTDDELREYRLHSVTGQSSVESVEGLKVAGRIIRHHHESFDGQGFPDGLDGEKIPLGSRIIAIGDFVDRTVAGSRDEDAFVHCLERVREEEGKMLDPRLCRVVEPLLRDLYPSLFGERPPTLDA